MNTILKYIYKAKEYSLKLILPFTMNLLFLVSGITEKSLDH